MTYAPLDRLLRQLALISAVLVAACSVTPPSTPTLPFHLPDSFATTTPAHQATGEAWWQTFNDAQLNQFIDQALQRNTGLAQALARHRIAEAQTRLNRADQLPQIGVGLNTTRQRQNLSGLPMPGSGSLLSTSHNVALDISWELDLWGRLSAMSAAAQADYLASGQQVRALRQSVAAQVARLYFDIVHARAQVTLSEGIVRALEEMARQINNRVQVGIASPADGMLANANLDSARAGLEQRREALERGLRQLDVLLGDYPSGQLVTASDLPDLSAPPPTGYPAELLARRPDVQAAELSLLSAGYRWSAAQRSFLPSLSLTGSTGYAGSELSQLFSASNLLWSIAGRMIQPVFQGGRLTAQLDIAEGQQSERLHAYAETALNALAEVESALVVDDLLQKRELALDRSASAAEEAVRVSYNRYLQGIDPFLNVLESQQRALDGRSAHISARQARLDNRIALHLALGGGFEQGPLP